MQAYDTNGESRNDSETSKTELRARWEAFEFRVPAPGRVRIENTSHGEDSEDHVYVVEVAEYVGATACTCPSDEYREGPCKHRLAVENQEVVMDAATTGLNGAYPAEESRVAADGGEEQDEGEESENDEHDEMDGCERPTRSEPADFGGGEGGMDEL